MVILKALTDAFAAKRAAEIAPGVGRVTDAWIVGRNAIVPVQSDIYERLDAIYRSSAKKKEEIDNEATLELQQYFDEMSKQGKASQSESAQETPAPTPPSGGS